MLFKKPSSIYFQFFYPLILVSILPLLLLGIGLASMAREAMIQQSSQDLISVATLLENELHVNLDDIMADAEVIAAISEINSGDIEFQTEVLKEQFLHGRRFSSLVIFDLDANPFASCHPHRKHVFDEEVFKSVSSLGLQSWSIYRTPHNEENYLIIYTPIRDENREISGILLAYVNLVDFERILRKVHLNQTAAMVLDPTGRIIFHPDRNLPIGKWAGSELLMESKMIGSGIISYKREKSVYDVGFATLVDFNWIVLVERPDLVVKAQGQKAYSLTLFVVLLTSFLVFATLTVLIKQLTQPIRQLAVLFRTTEQGISSEPLPDHSSSDEIGSLIMAFDHMRSTLFLQTEELRISKEKYKTLFDTVGEAIFIFDQETFEILDANPATSKLYGYTMDELVGLSCLEFSAEKDKSTQAARHISDRGKTVVPIRHHKHKNGSDLFIQLSGYKAVVENKNVMFAVCKDITEQIQMEKEKQELQRQLNHKSKMDAFGQIAGGMAHDFNNILSGILSSAQLIKHKNSNLDSNTIKYVELIEKSSLRASDLTKKLLLFSQKKEMVNENIDVVNILKDSIEILEHTIDKKITISAEILEKEAICYGDSSAIQSVILNLGINASHAMMNGGQILYRLSKKHIDKASFDSSLFDIEPGEFIEIDVSDTGSGISEDNLKKIFDPFFTTKEIGKGTGLGLSVSLRTVLDHKGAITVESAIGKGSSFYIFLPVSTASGEERS